jgi:myosin heavy chain 6/7
MSGYIDLNDPEVVESLKYLVVSKEERIKYSAMPFDAKKACWVPDHKEGFLAGEIESTNGDQVTVKTSNGEVKNSKKNLK